VSRPLLGLLLGLALFGTGAVAWLLLSDSGSSGRRDREAGEFRDETATSRPTGPAPRPRDDESTGKAGPKPGTWPVTGSVRDEGGDPIPGATVRATLFTQSFVETTTDAAGSYALELTEPGCAFDVVAAGYLPVSGTLNGLPATRFLCEGKGPWTKSFVLQPAATLTGYVRDGTGGPIRAAQVYVLPPENQLLDRVTVGNVVTSDARGAFSFPGLPPGTYDLGARAPGYLPGLVRDVVVPERGALRQEVVLEPGRAVVVDVVDPKPARSRVVLSDSRLRTKLLPPGGIDALMDALVGRAWVDYPVVSGAPGEIRGVGAGPADAEARALGEGEVRDDSWLVEDGLGRLLDTTESHLTLRLLKGVLVPIHVRDAVTGKALEPQVARYTDGAVLPVEKTPWGYWVPMDERRHVLHFTLSGYQEATLDLPDLTQGTFDLTAGTPRYATPFDVAMVPTAEGETGAFYVVFEPPLEGRLALMGRTRTGEPAWVRHVERPDAEGRWKVTDVPVGEYNVSVLATGMIPVVLSPVVVTRGFVDTHRVTLTKGGGMSFKVTDPEGKLLDQVVLRLNDAGGNQIDVHILTTLSEGRAFVSVNYLPSAATAAADSGLAPGDYTLLAGREGYEPGQASFSVSEGSVTDVSVTLRPKAAR